MRIKLQQKAWICFHVCYWFCCSHFVSSCFHFNPFSFSMLMHSKWNGHNCSTNQSFSKNRVKSHSYLAYFANNVLSCMLMWHNLVCIDLASDWPTYFVYASTRWLRRTWKQNTPSSQNWNPKWHTFMVCVCMHVCDMFVYMCLCVWCVYMCVWCVFLMSVCLCVRVMERWRGRERSVCV